VNLEQSGIKIISLTWTCLYSALWNAMCVEYVHYQRHVANAIIVVSSI